MSDALQTWRKKLAFLQEREAVVSGAEEKFAINQQIEEAQQKIRRLVSEAGENQSAPRIAPTRLHHGADHLFGRDEELLALDRLANDPTKRF